MNKIKLLDELVEKIGQLQYDDDENRKAVVSTAELYAKKFFEKDKSYEKRITEVSFFQ